jgi:CRP/FNR family transcriptional regulator
MKITADDIRERFPSFDAELVQDIITVAEIKVAEKGEYILRKGQYIRSMLLILEGLVKVLRENDNGNCYFIHYLQGGNAFALTMISGGKQEISEIVAVAFEKTILLIIPLTCMDKWMTEHKSWYQFVFDTFREKLRTLLNTIDNTVFLNMKERLVFYLKSYRKVLQSKNIPITRTEIAREMNSSREVITRLLKKLAYNGKIKMHRHYIEIMDL